MLTDLETKNSGQGNEDHMQLDKVRSKWISAPPQT